VVLEKVQKCSTFPNRRQRFYPEFSSHKDCIIIAKEEKFYTRTVFSYTISTFGHVSSQQTCGAPYRMVNCM
jgi:hypothetical protein